MTMTLYRIVTEEEWRAAREAGVFEGSPHDRRDGFLHFSAASQAAETAEKHHAGQEGLLLLFVDAASLRAPLKWEVSRGGQLFPHLYGALPVAAVRRAEKLPRGPDGRFLFPELEP